MQAGVSSRSLPCKGLLRDSVAKELNLCPYRLGGWIHEALSLGSCKVGPMLINSDQSFVVVGSCLNMQVLCEYGVFRT